MERKGEVIQVRRSSYVRPVVTLLLFLLAAGPAASARAASPRSFICPTGKIRIMPLGDSITQGSSSGVDNPTQQVSYRKDLYHSLTGAGYDVDFVGSQTNGDYYSDFDANHEGWPGKTAQYIADNIPTYLAANTPDIILLHIGTNGLTPDATPVENILNNIDTFETSHNGGKQITVLVARIINRVPETSVTTAFNDNVQAMVEARPDYGTSLFMVNMETGAGLIYALYPSGDIYDQPDKTVDLHPWETGYTKMADLWFSTLDPLLQNCNHYPIITQPADQTSSEGDSASLRIEATDPEGQTITYGASNLPQGLGINPITGVISGTIGYDAAEASPYTVTVTADDGAGGIASKNFQWLVSNTNRPPQVAYSDQTYEEGDPVSIFPASAIDPDGDAFTFSASGLPASLSIDASTGEISGTLGYEDAANSPYTVVVTATDNGTPSSAQGNASFQLAVANKNRAPVLAGLSNRRNAEGDSVSLQLQATDPDGDPLTYGATNLPEGLSLDTSTGLISGTLSYNAHLGSPHSVTVTVEDGAGGSDSQTFSWSVSDVDASPQVTNPGDQSNNAGEKVSLQIRASDPDQGDALVFSAKDLPAGLKIDKNTGEIKGVLSSGSGTQSIYHVAVSVKDSQEISSSVSFKWVVNNQVYVFLPLLIK